MDSDTMMKDLREAIARNSALHQQFAGLTDATIAVGTSLCLLETRLSAVVAALPRTSAGVEALIVACLLADDDVQNHFCRFPRFDRGGPYASGMGTPEQVHADWIRVSAARDKAQSELLSYARALVSKLRGSTASIAADCAAAAASALNADATARGLSDLTEAERQMLDTPSGVPLTEMFAEPFRRP